MYTIIHLPDVEDKLIDKYNEFSLTNKHLDVIKKMYFILKNNPHDGIKNKYNIPIKTDFYIEEYLGDNLYIRFFYNIELYNWKKNVIIKHIWIGYKM